MYETKSAGLFAAIARKAEPDFILAILESSFDGEKGEVIAIEWGDEGYHKTNLGRQTRAWVDGANAGAGIDPATAEAYHICSLFGRWEKFDEIKSTIEKKVM